MKVFQLITKEIDVPYKTIFIMACVSGIANGLLIALINTGSAYAVDGRVDISLIFAYILAVVIFVLALHYSMTHSARTTEYALLRLKLRIIDKLRYSDLRFIETHGSMSTFTPLTDGANLISQGLSMLVTAAQSILILIFSSLYLGYLSPLTLISILVIMALLLPIMISRNKAISSPLASAANQDAKFFEGFFGVLKGFKELKLNRPENDDLFSDIRKNSDTAYELKVEVNNYQAYNTLLIYTIYFLVLMAAVFAIPSIHPESSDTIHKVTATVLFMMAPIWPVAMALPLLSRVENVVSRLYALEESIDQAKDKTETKAPVKVAKKFDTIECQEITFRYTDKDGSTLFTAGPFDITLKQGDLIFIVGGNGSGKSTLLKLITGLYQPKSGSISLNGKQINSKNYAHYRTLFASVFTDFHLFHKLYGIPDLSASQVNTWLKEFDLNDKTTYNEQGFSNLELSTGQKKRLAIIAAILKQRPVCILDEPAADQDPPFRRRFYTQLLPKLREMGQTIIVVSHDEQYFHLADKIIRLREGQLIAGVDS